jgi:hypothetical protein
MSREEHQKITSNHLARSAYLYVRQSSLRQVLENTESTERQYALCQRAVALGWPHESILVIDTDLGQSGASAVDVRAFSGSWPTSGWDAPASSSGSRFRGWRAIQPTGTGCSRSAP